MVRTNTAAMECALLLLAVVPSCLAFAPTTTQIGQWCRPRQALGEQRRHGRRGTHLGLSMLDAASANVGLREAQAGALQLLLDGGLGLVDGEGFSSGAGTVQTFTGDDVSWLSAVQTDRLCQLTSWNGPLLSEVPHLRSCVEASDAGIDISMDFCPRGDGGYDTANADGSFPEPDSRAMFMQKQRRSDYAASFFTPAMEAWAAGLTNAPGAQPQALNRAAQLVGPIGLSVRLPLTDAGLDAAARACREAAGVYLGWMQGGERGGQTKSQQAFAHDCKVRAGMGGYTEKHLSDLLGAEAGGDLARADAGPRDLADRGGAMSAAAADNFQPNPLKY
ncbi:hypothetical protein T484DRAFT_3191575 [Baffinella frigidus]|nr:hypothetical protein T484DRAFT_3191575 [Cryptophyta sp. CCMP2293]|mmetsp:Transcript_62741/g.143798  ORF Transcript_62741/g.143798 Transcript_62741/m.143798 type:complete len:334 (+) Transcript_62741:44-1045(+)